MAVIVSTDQDFQQTLSQNKQVIVKYFADWCGSCKLFAPKYKRLSNDERFAGLTFVEVNAEQSQEARKKAVVTNLPYFAIFKEGELVDGICSSKEEAVVELIEKLKS